MKRSGKETEITLATAQRSIVSLAGRLRQIDEQLAILSSDLPAPSAEFEARAEVRGVIECVRAELLADAIMTLKVVGQRDETGLRMELLKRQLAQSGLQMGLPKQEVP